MNQPPIVIGWATGNDSLRAMFSRRDKFEMRAKPRDIEFIVMTLKTRAVSIRIFSRGTQIPTPGKGQERREVSTILDHERYVGVFLLVLPPNKPARVGRGRRY